MTTTRVTAITVTLRTAANTYRVEFLPAEVGWWRLTDCACWRPGPCAHKRMAHAALAAAFQNQPMPPLKRRRPVPAVPQEKSGAFSPAPTSPTTQHVDPRIARNQQRSSR